MALLWHLPYTCCTGCAAHHSCATGKCKLSKGVVITNFAPWHSHIHCIIPRLLALFKDLRRMHVVTYSAVRR